MGPATERSRPQRARQHRRGPLGRSRSTGEISIDPGERDPQGRRQARHVEARGKRLDPSQERRESADCSRDDDDQVRARDGQEMRKTAGAKSSVIGLVEIRLTEHQSPCERRSLGGKCRFDARASARSQSVDDRAERRRSCDDDDMLHSSAGHHAAAGATRSRIVELGVVEELCGCEVRHDLEPIAPPHGARPAVEPRPHRALKGPAVAFERREIGGEARRQFTGALADQNGRVYHRAVSETAPRPAERRDDLGAILLECLHLSFAAERIHPQGKHCGRHGPGREVATKKHECGGRGSEGRAGAHRQNPARQKSQPDKNARVDHAFAKAPVMPRAVLETA
jgi:hypothetical protein